MFGSRTVGAKLGEFFPVNILGNLLSPAEMVGLTLIFPSLTMSGIPVRFVLFMSVILSD